METEKSNPIQDSNLEVAPDTRRAPWWRLNKKLWLATGFVVVGCFVIALWRWHGNATSSSRTERLATVAVAKVTRENLVQQQTFDAEFRPYQEIDLHAKVAGFVKNINVDIGDRVAQGELLATLEVPGEDRRESTEPLAMWTGGDNDAEN